MRSHVSSECLIRSRSLWNRAFRRDRLHRTRMFHFRILPPINRHTVVGTLRRVPIPGPPFGSAAGSSRATPWLPVPGMMSNRACAAAATARVSSVTGSSAAETISSGALHHSHGGAYMALRPNSREVPYQPAKAAILSSSQLTHLQSPCLYFSSDAQTQEASPVRSASILHHRASSSWLGPTIHRRRYR